MICGTDLSLDRSPEGRPTFREDSLGAEVLSRPHYSRVVLKAADAERLGVIRGVVTTREEIAAALGAGEVVWCGEDANALLTKRAEERRAQMNETRRVVKQYGDEVRAAQAAKGADHAGPIAAARAHLQRLGELLNVGPHVATTLNMRPREIQDWIAGQEEILTKLGTP